MTTQEKIALAAIIVPNVIALLKWRHEASKSRTQEAETAPQATAARNKTKGDRKLWPMLVSSFVAVLVLSWQSFDSRELTRSAVTLIGLSCSTIVVTVVMISYEILYSRLQILTLQGHYIFEAIHPPARKTKPAEQGVGGNAGGVCC